MRKINHLTSFSGIVLLCPLISVSSIRASEVRDWSRMPGSGTTFCMLEHEGSLYPYRIFFPSSYRHAPKEKGGDVRKFPLVIACHPAGGDEIAYFEWKGNANNNCYRNDDDLSGFNCRIPCIYQYQRCSSQHIA